MNYSFKYSEKEFKKAMRESYDDSKRMMFDLILTIVLLSYGIYLTVTSLYEVFSAVIIVISVMYLFLIFSKYFIVPSIAFKRDPKFSEVYELSFLENEIVFKAGNMKSTIPWNYYVGIKETNEFIFLKYGKKRATFIPKRIFRGNEEIKEFIDLVKSKINKF
jgi:hypothetical protein